MLRQSGCEALHSPAGFLGQFLDDLGPVLKAASCVVWYGVIGLACLAGFVEAGCGLLMCGHFCPVHRVEGPALTLGCHPGWHL